MTAPVGWRVEDAPFRLAVLDVDCAVAERAAYAALLSADEIARAQAYRYPIDADRFIVRRAWLRIALAEVAGADAASLRFKHGRFGKPMLAGYPDICFSASHSRGLAILAVADGRAIGCDVERCDPALAQPDIAERFFSLAERASLATLSGEAWLDGFFACWTRKEAYVKAFGTGLSHPMQGFSVSLAPEEPVQLLDAEPGWTMAAPNVGQGWRAAVVCAIG